MRIWANTFNVTTPDDTSIVVRRDFDAPPDKVWRAMTEPEHLRRWLGDPSFPLTTCEMDVRVGGSYRWVFTQPDGPGVMGVRGTYDEVDRPHRGLLRAGDHHSLAEPLTPATRGLLERFDDPTSWPSSCAASTASSARARIPMRSGF